MPEIMTFGIHEDSNGLPTSDAFVQLDHLLKKANVAHYGSGVLLTDETRRLAIELLKNVEQPLVLDGGAIIGLAKHHDEFKKRKAETVITPHTGEMAQLLGTSREKVEADRIGIAREFAVKNNTIVVLKGAPTIFASPDGTVFINATGNAGMATAGAGDVLCGMISGMIAQKPEDVLEAVMFAVYAHGLAGDIAAETMTEQAMIATDIIGALPAAFKKLGVK
jgi:NAD(P)H-hydrate epimerase